MYSSVEVDIPFLQYQLFDHLLQTQLYVVFDQFYFRRLQVVTYQQPTAVLFDRIIFNYLK